LDQIAPKLVSGTTQADLLWTATRIVRNTHRCSFPALTGGRERYHDRTVSRGGHRSAAERAGAGAGQGKAIGVGARKGDAVDGQGRVARVRQRHRFGRAGGVHVLSTESETSGGQAHRRRAAHRLGDGGRRAAGEVGVAAVCRRQRPGSGGAEGQRTASRPGTEGSAASLSRAGIHRDCARGRTAPGHIEAHRHRLPGAGGIGSVRGNYGRTPELHGRRGLAGCG